VASKKTDGPGGEPGEEGKVSGAGTRTGKKRCCKIVTTRGGHLGLRKSLDGGVGGISGNRGRRCDGRGVGGVGGGGGGGLNVGFKGRCDQAGLGLGVGNVRKKKKKDVGCQPGRLECPDESVREEQQ